jgi:hypothetical protein
LDTLLFAGVENTDNTDADEPPFVASNEIILNVEPVSGSVCVADVVADARFISCVDPRSTAIGFDLDADPPSISQSSC